MRILIVDDARLQRFNLGRILTGLGHEIIEAVDGDDGLLKIADPTIDLVISDLLMPKRDGFSLASELKSRRPDLPVIICSADIQSTSRERCHALGVRAFLNKPIDAIKLAEAIAALGGTP